MSKSSVAFLNRFLKVKEKFVHVRICQVDLELCVAGDSLEPFSPFLFCFETVFLSLQSRLASNLPSSCHSFSSAGIFLHSGFTFFFFFFLIRICSFKTWMLRKVIRSQAGDELAQHRTETVAKLTELQRKAFADPMV